MAYSPQTIAHSKRGSTMNKHRWSRVVPLALTLIAGCTANSTGGLASEELEEVRRSSSRYFDAWLSNDPEVVMQTFVSDPVLAPSGMPYLEGEAAARAFWWPAGSPPSTVTAFEHEELEAAGAGDLGYVRGTYTLVFEWDGTTYTNRGKYLHMLRRVPGEGWRISHHFWNDLPSEENEP